MKYFLVLGLIFLSACGSTKSREREIDARVAATAVSDSKALGEKIEELLESSATLSKTQKQQLRTILLQNKQRADMLSDQSFRYRAVLIQELLSGKVDYKKVAILKRDIQKVENLRLKNTFETVERISQIVSKNPNHKNLAEKLFSNDQLDYVKMAPVQR